MYLVSVSAPEVLRLGLDDVLERDSHHSYLLLLEAVSVTKRYDLLSYRKVSRGA